jgi:hypothetical protein
MLISYVTITKDPELDFPVKVVFLGKLLHPLHMIVFFVQTFISTDLLVWTVIVLNNPVDMISAQWAYLCSS